MKRKMKDYSGASFAAAPGGGRKKAAGRSMFVLLCSNIGKLLNGSQRNVDSEGEHSQEGPERLC